jgi:hypothetical protein
MLKRTLPLSVIAAAAFALPAHAQNVPYSDPQAPQTYDWQPQLDDDYPQQRNNGYGQPYNYGQPNAYYQYDWGFQTAVNSCAYQAARANLSRVVVREVERPSSDRFQVEGWAEWYQGPRNSPYGYGTPQNPQAYGYGYRPYAVSFSCTADSWGRVLGWSTRRR